MPRRKQQKKVMAPYSFTLPGGSEFEALGTGYAFLREANARNRGYIEAALIANHNVLSDASSQQPWIIADVKTGILRSMNGPQLFKAYGMEMEELFTDENAGRNISQQEFSRGRAWREAVDLANNKPLTGSFDELGSRYMKLKEGVFLHHRTKYQPQPPHYAPPFIASPSRRRLK